MRYLILLAMVWTVNVCWAANPCPDYTFPDGDACVRAPCNGTSDCQKYADYCSQEYDKGRPWCITPEAAQYFGAVEIGCKCLGSRIKKCTTAADCSCSAGYDPYCSRTRCSCSAGASCNRLLDGDSKCGPGKRCGPNKRCINDPGCSFLYEQCDTKGCCDGFCHARLGDSTKSCQKVAFAKESCSSGIPCENGHTCLPNGKCSLGPGDACDRQGDVCPHGYYCSHVPLGRGVNKECQKQ